MNMGVRNIYIGTIQGEMFHTYSVNLRDKYFGCNFITVYTSKKHMVTMKGSVSITACLKAKKEWIEKRKTLILWMMKKGKIKNRITCDLCISSTSGHCEFAFDKYNLDGDCMGVK